MASSVWMAIDCPACHGDGTVTVNPAHPDPRGAIDVRCDACDGTGSVDACGHGVALTVDCDACDEGNAWSDLLR